MNGIIIIFEIPNINNFLSGVKYLINSGYTVIRYGKNPRNNLNFQNENYIDLANSPYRTDLLEMYLVSKSYFALDQIVVVQNFHIGYLENHF